MGLWGRVSGSTQVDAAHTREAGSHAISTDVGECPRYDMQRPHHPLHVPRLPARHAGRGGPPPARRTPRPSECGIGGGFGATTTTKKRGRGVPPASLCNRPPGLSTGLADGFGSRRVVLAYPGRGRGFTPGTWVPRRPAQCGDARRWPAGCIAPEDGVAAPFHPALQQHDCILEALPQQCPQYDSTSEARRSTCAVVQRGTPRMVTDHPVYSPLQMSIRQWR